MRMKKYQNSQHFLKPDTPSIQYNLYLLKGISEKFVGFILNLKNTN